MGLSVNSAPRPAQLPSADSTVTVDGVTMSTSDMNTLSAFGDSGTTGISGDAAVHVGRDPNDPNGLKVHISGVDVYANLESGKTVHVKHFAGNPKKQDAWGDAGTNPTGFSVRQDFSLHAPKKDGDSFTIVTSFKAYDAKTLKEVGSGKVSSGPLSVATDD